MKIALHQLREPVYYYRQADIDPVFIGYSRNIQLYLAGIEFFAPSGRKKEVTVQNEFFNPVFA